MNPKDAGGHMGTVTWIPMGDRVLVHDLYENTGEGSRIMEVVALSDYAPNVLVVGEVVLIGRYCGEYIGGGLTLVRVEDIIARRKEPTVVTPSPTPDAEGER